MSDHGRKPLVDEPDRDGGDKGGKFRRERAGADGGRTSRAGQTSRQADNYLEHGVLPRQPSDRGEVAAASRHGH